MSVERIRKLLAEARPAPWHHFRNRHRTTDGKPWGCIEVQRHPAGGAGIAMAYWQGQQEDREAELLVLLRNHAEALCDLADAARWLPDDGETHAAVGTSCHTCEEPWPCPTSQIRAALARLDGDRTTEDVS